MLESSNEDFKAALIKIIQHTIMNIKMKTRKLQQKIEDIRKNKMEILELKSTVRKSSLDDLKSRKRGKESVNEKILQ